MTADVMEKASTQAGRAVLEPLPAEQADPATPRQGARTWTDNASEFRSAEFDRAVAQVGARHLFIRAGRPQTNGVVERVQQTILEECWKPAFARYLIPKYTGLRLDLDRYLHYYNTDRAHTGRWTKGRTPEEVLGKVKMWSRQS